MEKGTLACFIVGVLLVLKTLFAANRDFCGTTATSHGRLPSALIVDAAALSAACQNRPQSKIQP